MPIFKFGFIIKRRREEMGYTQEELSDGICSVPTLSRIENGERMPTKEHFEMLIQRLGYSNTSLDSYVDEKDFTKHELKYQLRQAIILQKSDDAAKLLRMLENTVSDPTPIDQQFFMLYQILIHPNKYTEQEQLKIFETALRLTCPKYTEGHFPLLLSYEEIILANNIAICYFYSNDQEQAVKLLYELKKHYENKVANQEEALRTQPMVLYNLSKFLGILGRYEESIEISSQGIRLSKETGRCSLLGMLLYNKAWAIVKQGDPSNFENAKKLVKEAFYMSKILQQTSSTEHYQMFYLETFGESISL